MQLQCMYYTESTLYSKQYLHCAVLHGPVLPVQYFHYKVNSTYIILTNKTYMVRYLHCTIFI